MKKITSLLLASILLIGCTTTTYKSCLRSGRDDYQCRKDANDEINYWRLYHQQKQKN